MPDIKAATPPVKTQSQWDKEVEEDVLPAPTTFLRQSGAGTTGSIGEGAHLAGTLVGGSRNHSYCGEANVQEAMEEEVVQGDQEQEDDEMRADASGEHKHKHKVCICAYSCVCVRVCVFVCVLCACACVSIAGASSLGVRFKLHLFLSDESG